MEGFYLLALGLVKLALAGWGWLVSGVGGMVGGWLDERLE